MFLNKIFRHASRVYERCDDRPEKYNSRSIILYRRPVYNNIILYIFLRFISLNPVHEFDNRYKLYGYLYTGNIIIYRPYGYGHLIISHYNNVLF